MNGEMRITVSVTITTDDQAMNTQEHTQVPAKAKREAIVTAGQHAARGALEEACRLLDRR
jgi:hypothetical protein